MHILCTICSDIVSPQESLYVTKCGHLFHHHCLSQWIERSKTCPQCRNQVTRSCMWRVYPTAASAAAGEDAAALQARLDDALLATRTAAVQRAAADYARDQLQQRLDSVQEQLSASENRLVRSESAANALREQLTYVRAQSRDAGRLRTECENLRGKLELLQSLQKVVDATADEVETMLEGYSDARTLAVFAAAFKRAVGSAEQARRGAAARLAAARAALAVERARADHLAATNVKLKALIATEPHGFMKRKSLEAERSQTIKKRRLEPRGSLTSSHEDADTTSTESQAMPAPSDVSLGTLVANIETADSPYWRLRSAPPAFSLQPKLDATSRTAAPSTSSGIENKSAAANNASNKSATNKYSIFHNKPQTSPRQYFDFNATLDPDLSYDGLGGHSKLDTFPEPKAPMPKKSFAPKLSAKHKLSRKPTTQDIGAMIKKINDKKSDQ